MAPKKTDSSATFTPEIVESTSLPAVIPPQSTALAVPDDAHDMRGKEGMAPEDFVLPRVTLAQSTTPQVKRGNKAQIEGLMEGQIFNTLTEENLGDTTRVIVLGVKKVAYVFDDKGKIIERGVPFDSPRCEKPKGPDGQVLKDEKGKERSSEAARCYEFIVFLPDAQAEAGRVALIRCKRTQLGPARKLMTFMGLTAGASWNAVYPATSVTDQFDGFTFYNWKFGMGTKTTPAQRSEAERLYNTFSGKTIVVVEPEFDVDAMDATAMAADQGDGI